MRTMAAFPLFHARRSTPRNAPTSHAAVTRPRRRLPRAPGIRLFPDKKSRHSTRSLPPARTGPGSPARMADKDSLPRRRDGLASGPGGAAKGETPCGVPDCTLRKVFEYLPQSTQVLSAKYAGGPRTAPQAIGHERTTDARMPDASGPNAVTRASARSTSRARMPFTG